MKKKKKKFKKELRESELGKTICGWLKITTNNSFWSDDHAGDIFEEAFEEIANLLEDFLNQQKEEIKRVIEEKKKKVIVANDDMDSELRLMKELGYNNALSDILKAIENL